ncbi:PQQ-binding-like beta-propeller repeat protein, partial [Streptomyces sp. NPDC096080]|uniref:PQQ-binding-like beta-propeller repeat protein n=1 Tax=Streptomyces sp. NPDC096080 TaxID=3156693 RepID=UPI00331EAA5D
GLAGQTPPHPAPPPDTRVAAQPTPAVAADTVYGSAPDGTVFAVDARRPGSW